MKSTLAWIKSIVKSFVLVCTTLVALANTAYADQWVTPDPGRPGCAYKCINMEVRPTYIAPACHEVCSFAVTYASKYIKSNPYVWAGAYLMARYGCRAPCHINAQYICRQTIYACSYPR